MEAHDIRIGLSGLRELKLSRATTAAEAAAAFSKLAPYNGGGVFVGRFSGRSPWERHPTGDELLHVLEGEVEVTVLAESGRLTSPCGRARSSSYRAVSGTARFHVRP